MLASIEGVRPVSLEAVAKQVDDLLVAAERPVGEPLALLGEELGQGRVDR